MVRRIFSSESVTEGHPDKMCDIISDAVLDEILRADPCGRVACETTACVGMIHLMGEITTDAHPDYEAIVRKTVNEIGYDGESAGFDGNNCAVMLSLNRQSMDIDLGVSRALESRDFGNQKGDIGAGDQGMMFGFACQNTEELMPLPITLAHRLAKRLAEVRKDGTLDYLRPDGKSQVSVEYEDDRPIRIDTVVIAAQHQPYVSAGRISRDVIREVILPTLPENLVDDNTRFLVNTTGRFSIGGPKGDTGLTGRKIIVDTYGGYASHGGGAFSGKDPTKVDRTGSYAARYIAKNIVASGAAQQCSIQLAYSIGVAQPVSVYISTNGTGKVSDEVLASVVRNKVDLRPAALIERFDMRRPIYKQVAAYGHFGRQELDLPWEKTDITNLF